MVEESKIAEQRVRINDQIRISPVRLIDDEGGQVGIVSIEEARELAQSKGLDVVEVAPDARPPVCKLMDYGKHRYEAQRAAKEAKKKQHRIEVKEVKFRPNTDQHDYNFKKNHAVRFLTEGNKVKAVVFFRGREITHSDLGRKILFNLAKDVEQLGEIEGQPRLEGRQMHVIIGPKKQRQKEPAREKKAAPEPPKREPPPSDTASPAS